MSEDHIADTALRIVVTPSQSSYFAGEPLSVTITITNTRSPQASQVAPPRSTHKRSAHSVSSARLARPPTSPGLSKNTLNTPLRQAPPKSSAPTRKGLIGTAPPENGPPSERESISQRRFSAKSLSVDIQPHELPNSIQDDMKISSLHAPRRAGGSSFSHDEHIPQIRRAKLASCVIPTCPHINHTRTPKSPSCSKGINRRWFGFNPAECFHLVFRAFPRSHRRKHVPRSADTHISFACAHTIPIHFPSRCRQHPTHFPCLPVTLGHTPPFASPLGKWSPFFSQIPSKGHQRRISPVRIRASHRLTFSATSTVTCACSSARYVAEAQAWSTRWGKHGHRRRVSTTFPRS